MEFRVAADIARPPPEVFAFFRDVDRQQRDPASLVPVLEKTSAGPTGVGSTFHEVVRVLPHRTADVESEIIRFNPPRQLDYLFRWRLGRSRIDGALHYDFSPLPDGGTHVDQVQILEPQGRLRWLAPYLRWSFGFMVRRRMNVIKRQLERRPPPAG